MVDKPPNFFIHRHNHDGSWDSLCIECFRTVATTKAETELPTQESTHICQALDLNNSHRADNQSG